MYYYIYDIIPGHQDSTYCILLSVKNKIEKMQLYHISVHMD
jgi:hypothetical protein